MSVWMTLLRCKNAPMMAAMTRSAMTLSAQRADQCRSRSRMTRANDLLTNAWIDRHVQQVRE